MYTFSQVVDARSSERFKGEVPEPRPSLPSGGMNGAANLHYSRVLNDQLGTFKNKTLLAKGLLAYNDRVQSQSLLESYISRPSKSRIFCNFGIYIKMNFTISVGASCMGVKMPRDRWFLISRYFTCINEVLNSMCIFALILSSTNFYISFCVEFKRSGVDLSQPLVSTCGSGVTAAIIAIAGHTLHTSIPLYDVS